MRNERCSVAGALQNSIALRHSAVFLRPRSEHRLFLNLFQDRPKWPKQYPWLQIIPLLRDQKRSAVRGLNVGDHIFPVIIQFRSESTE